MCVCLEYVSVCKCTEGVSGHKRCRVGMKALHCKYTHELHGVKRQEFPSVRRNEFHC